MLLQTEDDETNDTVRCPDQALSSDTATWTRLSLRQ